MDILETLGQKIYTEAGLVALLLFIGNLYQIVLYKQMRGDAKDARDRLDRQSDRTLDVMEKNAIILTRIDGKIK